ncbi:MAG TPA: HAD-IA family hydrolase [Armatimonadota bacterium]|nr:HAD-IA family hydrolase [Armatimonadota bacterium]
MIQVLVSDLGQVVLPFDFSPTKEFMRSRSAPGEIDPWTGLFDLHERLNFGTGGCPAREFYEHIVLELKLDATYEEFCRAWCDVFVEDHAVVDLIRRANVQHRFLLSNTNVIHWDWILANNAEILQVFDRLVASHEVGAAKPDPAIYKHVEAITGLPSAAHLLIDDLAPNIEGARACGWDGIIHTDANNLEIELRRRGLLR